MKSLRPLLLAGLLSSAWLPAANAAIMTWDFTLEVEDVYRDDANVIDDSIVAGSLLSGSFSYDNGLTDSTPGFEYSDGYDDPAGWLTIDGLGLHDWKVEVSVVHQSSRDIVDIEGTYLSGDIHESVEIGFLDYSQSYDGGELPLNWHRPPVDFSDIDFDYTYDLGTDPCCSDSWLQGEIQSITLRQPVNVPEPSSLLLLSALGLGAAYRRRNPVR